MHKIINNTNLVQNLNQVEALLLSYNKKEERNKNLQTLKFQNKAI